jgi:hypothetical protein
MNAPAPDLVRSCYGKRAYPSEPHADSVANRVWCERKVSLRVYWCDGCSGWHLTKLDAPQRMKPGFRPPLRPAAERAAYNERRRRRERGRK